MNDQGRKVLGGQVPLRFVQIAVGVASDPENGGSESILGLDAEGQVWEYRTKAIPKTRMVASSRQGQYIEQRYYECLKFWHPLRMSQEPGPEHEVRE